MAGRGLTNARSLESCPHSTKTAECTPGLTRVVHTRSIGEQTKGSFHGGINGCQKSRVRSDCTLFERQQNVACVARSKLEYMICNDFLANLENSFLFQRPGQWTLCRTGGPGAKRLTGNEEILPCYLCDCVLEKLIFFWF